MLDVIPHLDHGIRRRSIGAGELHPRSGDGGVGGRSSGRRGAHVCLVRRNLDAGIGQVTICSVDAGVAAAEASCFIAVGGSTLRGRHTRDWPRGQAAPAGIRSRVR